MHRPFLLMTAAFLTVLLASGGDAFARGGNRGNGGCRQGLQSQARSSSQGTGINAPSGQLRPEDSRRRDGTFATTGTTANGSTTRPGHGRGTMDGTGCTTPAATE